MNGKKTHTHTSSNMVIIYWYLVGCKDKSHYMNPRVVTLGHHYNVGEEKPTVILYTLFLSFVVFVLFLFCFVFMLSLELCRFSSDLFLSSRPGTGLATTYITGYG